MKVYKTQAEVEKDIKDYVLVVNDNVRFECSISVDASLKINGNINAHDINAFGINALSINARNITAHDIDALNITAHDIDAFDINALSINARNISYYAFCTSYKPIKCISIKAKRDNHAKPICLDGRLEEER